MEEEGRKDKEPFHMIIRVDGARARDIDLTTLRPFTLGDRKKLIQEFNLDFKKGTDFSLDDDINLTFFIVRKVDPSVTVQEIEDLPTVVAQDIVAYALNKSQEVDRPFLKLFMQSHSPTDGA